MTRTNHMAYLLLGSLLWAGSCSSSKNDTPAPTGPKEYQVEYRLTSSTNTSAGFVMYANETGGDTQLANEKLPATYTFKRTMKAGDRVNISGGISVLTASEITATILLDGKEVKTVTARGTNSLATAVYIIGQ